MVFQHSKALRGTGILLSQDFCGKTMQAVTEQPIKQFNFLEFPRVSSGDQPLAKEPEGSGYEIDHNEKHNLFKCKLVEIQLEQISNAAKNRYYSENPKHIRGFYEQFFSFILFVPKKLATI